MMRAKQKEEISQQKTYIVLRHLFKDDYNKD